MKYERTDRTGVRTFDKRDRRNFDEMKSDRPELKYKIERTDKSGVDGT